MSYMIYVLNNIDFQTVVCDYGALFAKNDIILLGNSIFPTMDIYAETKGHTDILNSMLQLSSDKQLVLISASNIVSDNETYNSAIVVDKGEFVGICDEIFADTFAHGNAIVYFSTSVGRIALILGNDILYPHLWIHYLGKNISKIFFINNGEFSSRLLNMAQSVAISSGCPVYCNFCNIAISIDNFGKIAQMEIGILRPFVKHIGVGNEYCCRKIFPVINEKAQKEN